jgi:nucleotide-binding universal stress UspA family protein
MTTYPILVGYDGSHPARAALHWALDDAARCHAPVRVVYVYEWATPVVPVPAGVGWPDPRARREAVAAVDEAVARARIARPGVPITGMVVDGPLTSTLRALSQRAQLLVLGDRGLGGFPGLLAGSVAVTGASAAHCPVVVVRGCARPSLPVVVGVDESPEIDDVVGFAAEQAAARGVELVAVRAWQPPPVPRRGDLRPLRYAGEDAGGELVATARRLADQALHGWRDKFPQVPMTTRLAPGSATAALVAASADAQLVVVGCRGRGGCPGVPLGSVARQLLHHTHCPVAVVRATGTPE